MRFSRWLIIIVMLFASCSFATTPKPASGKDSSVELTNTDIMSRLDLFIRELEIVRIEMGKPVGHDVTFTIDSAGIHELYHQAITLLRKTNRLSYEYTRTTAIEPDFPTGEIKPHHIWEIIDLALSKVLLIKNNITQTKPLIEYYNETNTSASEIFSELLYADEQLNALLNEKIPASHIYQQVNRAINLSERILGLFGLRDRLPEPSDYQSGKQPSDIFNRLVHCFSILRQIAEKSDIEILKLTITSTEQRQLSEVYDVAGIIVSNLEYIYRKANIVDPPAKTYYPGIKFPSHVDQRISILERQLSAILKQVNKSPYWLLKGQ